MGSRIPKYRRHSQRNFGFVEMDGTRVRLPGRFGSEESRASYAAIVQEIAATPVTITLPANRAGLTSLNTLLLAYLDFAKSHYTNNGSALSAEYHHYRGVARAVNQTKWGRLPLASFGPLALQEVRDEMVQIGWARKYTNAQTNRLRRVLTWGVSREVVPPNVLIAVRAVQPLLAGRTGAKESKPIPPVEQWALDETRKYLPPIIDTMVQVHALTGMRPQNICGMTPGQIDMTDDVWLYIPRWHKSAWRDARPLIIPLGPLTQELIRPLLNRRDEDHIFSPSEAYLSAMKDRPYLGCKSRRTTLFTPTTYRDSIHRAIDRANKTRPEDNKLPKWSPNQLRHLAATRIRSKYGTEAAQTVLGHSSLSTTEIYAERDLNLAQKVAFEMG
jgi:integrase